MAGRGPAPAPTALRVLRGDRKDRINLAEPIPPPAQGKAPAFVTRPALKYWRKWWPVQAQMRVMTAADEVALGLMANTLQEYVEARRVVDKQGMTFESQHVIIDADGNEYIRRMIRARPEVAIASDAWKRLKSMMEQFGMTPASRSRLTVKAPESTGSLLD